MIKKLGDYIQHIDWLVKYEWSLNFSIKERNNYIIKIIVAIFIAGIIRSQINKYYYEYHIITNIIMLLLVVWWIFSIYRTWILKIFAKKRLKQEWLGILVKTKVNKIIENCVDRDWVDEYYHYLECVDKDGFIYRSSDLWAWIYIKDPKPDLNFVFKHYWFDEFKEDKLDLVLSTINDKIMELEFEKKDASFLKKPKIVYELNSLNHDKSILEKWYYIANFKFKNWKKIFVWDEINVYKDPINKDYFYVDIDNFVWDKK